MLQSVASILLADGGLFEQVPNSSSRLYIVSQTTFVWETGEIMRTREPESVDSSLGVRRISLHGISRRGGALLFHAWRRQDRLPVCADRTLQQKHSGRRTILIEISMLALSFDDFIVAAVIERITVIVEHYQNLKFQTRRPSSNLDGSDEAGSGLVLYSRLRGRQPIVPNRTWRPRSASESEKE